MTRTNKKLSHRNFVPQNFGQSRQRGRPCKILLASILITAKFVCCASYRVGVCGKSLKSLGRWGPAPWDRDGAWPQEHATPHKCYAEFGRSRWHGKSVYAPRSTRKIGPVASRFPRSLKLSETDTDRSATYDFLLVLHSNISLSHAVS